MDYKMKNLLEIIKLKMMRNLNHLFINETYWNEGYDNFDDAINKIIKNKARKKMISYWF